MIDQSRLHTCPSYSCLLSLQEKPNCFNTRPLSPRTVITTSSPTWTPLLIDDAYVRSTSPFSVVYDDDDSFDEDDPWDDILLPSSLSKSPSFTQPLKEPSESSLPLERSHSDTSLVTFTSTVTVTSIPSHRDYPVAMKQRIWSSMEEMRVNAVKAQMQLYLEEDYSDDDNDDDDIEWNEPQNPKSGSARRFVPLQRMQQTL